MDAVQDVHAPHGTCFGCGSTNEKGLRIKSRWEDDAFVCEWTPASHHEAFPGILNGGIIASVLDCHSNWCAAMTLKRREGLDEPPVTVTAGLDLRLKRPTPMDGPLRLVASATRIDGPKVTVEARLEAGGATCATSTALLFRVGPDHPAYGAWGATA